MFKLWKSHTIFFSYILVYIVLKQVNLIIFADLRVLYIFKNASKFVKMLLVTDPGPYTWIFKFHIWSH